MVGEGEQYFHFRKLYYDRPISNILNAATDIQFRFAAKRQLGQPARQLGPYRARRFLPNSASVYDGEIDLKFAARVLRLKVEAAADLDWSVGRIRLDMRPGGSR